MAPDPLDPRPDPSGPPDGRERALSSTELLVGGVPPTAAQERALGIAAAAALLAIAWVARPLAVGLLLGTLAAFSLQPFYDKLRARWARPRLAALASVGLTALAFLATVGGLGYLLVGRGIPVAEELLASLEPEGQTRALLVRLARPFGAIALQPNELIARLRGAAAELTAEAARVAAAVAAVTFDGLLTLFFVLMMVYFILNNWSSMVRRAERIVPLHPRQTHELLDEFRRVGRSVLLGTVITGLAQGLLASACYFAVALPHAAFFGAATAVASLIPGVGTLLVWVPAGGYLLLTGHPVRGVLELVYGALVVVGLSDYLIRPLLVGGSGEAPALLTFVALFGGVEAFGLFGLILGPIVMAIAVAVLRIYERERARRGPLGDSSGAHTV